MNTSETDSSEPQLSRDQWITRLKTTKRKQLKRIFHDLPVPAVEEFNGEFEGFLLDQGNSFGTAVTRFFINKKGIWLGKAFRPTSPDHAQGYNIFRTRNGILRCLRMQIFCRDDNGRPKVTIEYAGINRGLVGGINDEMRRVAPGLFLGIGNVPIGGKLFPQLTGRVMFAMAGPVADFQEDATEEDLFRRDETFTGVAA